MREVSVAIKSGVLALTLALATFVSSAQAGSEGRTVVNVLVTDAETGQPINQARLTLQFREPGSVPKLKRPKWLSYSAKTNSQGLCKFLDIPRGTVHLIVTSERHETYGKDLEVEGDNPVLAVKLKKPQPLL